MEGCADVLRAHGSDAGPVGSDAVLVGRSTEREVLTGLLARAAAGCSGALVLRGEPGVGKSALLDDTAAAAMADGIQTARLTGVESETQLGYAALHRFLLPFRGQLERLPGPQRQALRSTFGQVAGPPADRFLVALGVLTLLADIASRTPLLCLVDDTQWLDPESAVVLGFVARRLCAERVVLVFADRLPSDQLSALSGIPELPIDGLGGREAAELLSSITSGRLNPAVGTRIAVETGGNPLALVELARELSAEQLAGSAALPEPLPVGDSLQEVFSGRLSQLPPEARLLLAVAAAEPTAPEALLWRVAEQLGVDLEAAVPAVKDLVEFTPQVVFRHPLVRSAVYHLTPLSQRRLIHRALADAGEASEQPDRVAWHLGIAALGPDEAAAAQLEQAAGRARERGGYAATATFLCRAAELSVHEGPRARRLLAAAEAELAAGAPDRAGALLDRARAGPVTELQAGTTLRLSGDISLATGQLADAPSQLLAAARSLMPADAALGRRTLLRALEAGNYAGRHGLEDVRVVAAEIQPGASAADPPSTIVDRLLFGLLHRLAGEYRQAAPLLRGAVAELQDEAVPGDLRLPWMRLGTMAATELFDYEVKAAVAAEHVRLARRRGALTALPRALISMGDAHLREGRFALADDAHDEGRQIAAATGNQGLPGQAVLPDLAVLAWRGHGAKARVIAAKATDEINRGLGSGIGLVHARLAVLEVGLGNYRDALRHAQYAYREDVLAWGTYVLPELVEAAVRCAEPGAAQRAADRLAARAQASGASWGLGLSARCRALVACNSDAEPLYQEAIALLGTTRARPDLARAHLVYGEWLRRQRRRRDARDQLRTAYDMLAEMGAEAFAERARIELHATGERARKRSPAADELTPQEAQIARLVREGGTNRDIASQLFISPATVEYHLRKAFRKLGVTSRTQLARAMSAGGT
jgi:DNA-binding CsgD family transcriptional regulator